MQLQFGPIKIDTKGLPAIYWLHVFEQVDQDAPLHVDIMLAGNKRAAVEKWAKRLGGQVTERDVPDSTGFDVHTREIEAVVERDGYRIAVWTRFTPAPAPKTDATPEAPGGAS